MRLLQSLLGLGCAIALFAMMALTSCDVVARKFLGNSIAGATELTELLMLITIFFGLPLTSLRKEHVAFDLMDNILPSWCRGLQHIIANLFCAAILLGGSWLVAQRARRALEDGDHTAQLGVYLGPLYYLTALLLLLTALVHLYLLFANRPRTHA